MSHNMRPYSNYNGAFAQRYEGSEPVTLGGQTRAGEDATNALTYVMLDAADRSRAALNFVVRTHAGSPEALFDAVAAIHARGCSSVSIMNDAVGIAALQRRGFDELDARDYAITGCVDMCAPGKTGGEAFSALLLCRVLDMTLRNGDSQTLIGSVRGVGPRTGDPDTFTSFDQLVDAFIAQAEHAVEQIVKASRIRDELYAEHLPAPLISAFMQGCLERKRDVTHGGALYDLEGILFMNSIANVVDSLHVIRTLVFERRRCTFRQLLDAIDHNFVGHEELHREMRAIENRWGNGDPATDALARQITDRLFDTTYRHRTYKGGHVAPFVNSMTSHTYDGRISIATPDGRRAGTAVRRELQSVQRREGGADRRPALRGRAGFPAPARLRGEHPDSSLRHRPHAGDATEVDGSDSHLLPARRCTASAEHRLHRDAPCRAARSRQLRRRDREGGRLQRLFRGPGPRGAE